MLNLTMGCARLSQDDRDLLNFPCAFLCTATSSQHDHDLLNSGCIALNVDRASEIASMIMIC